MQFAWQPDSATIERAQLTRFLKFTGHGDFQTMYRWSIDDVPGFTDAVLRFLRIPFTEPYTQVVDMSRGMEWPRWCVGGRLNIASACLDPHPPDRLAVLWEGEEGNTRSLTYSELTAKVSGFAARLSAFGIGQGDAVGIHLPMVPETVIVLLACAHIGALAVPLFSGYGPGAIETRLRDVNAKVLITFDAFPRRGVGVHGVKCDFVPKFIVIPRNGISDFGSARFADTGAEDPLIAIYTSGTTGRPKGILHTHCGFPIKSAQDMCFGMDVGAGTRICWVTDIGWMMGPWLIYGALLLGATICLYDGAPDYPGPGRMWEFCERHRVEVLGISPTLVRALAVHGTDPVRAHDLSSLRILASTGEPWNPDPWWWLFREVGQSRIPIINYSGGTEISGGILCCNPLLPLKPCSFSAPCPGIAADIMEGELVIRKPWIGMARGFLNDPQRYIETYWSRFPGVWTHGDWVSCDEDGHWYILGRSDDTLKIAGKRVGPAEVESILVAHEDVMEAAVIGVPHNLKGECMVAFCVLRPGVEGSVALASILRDSVGTELGKPLRPEAVHFVAAIPKTRNAKVMRRVIRSAWMGNDPGDITALENPQSVDTIRSARNTT
ncbi:MAG: AMP-binding protein [Bryobacteraceae bacterium]|nr:AMP-binding protein [Bryobacteraceae bacterium]